MDVLKGAAAGFAATVPMTIAMEALRACFPREQTRRAPPREVIDRTVDKTTNGAVVESKDRFLLTTAAHFGFGTAAGALYAAFVASRRSSGMLGVTYGLAVWGLAYGVALPSLGLHPAASEDTGERNQVLIASHVVWGWSVGKMMEAGRR
jgi:uncharacterized membrane protein YagU involved in acid resistance